MKKRMGYYCLLFLLVILIAQVQGYEFCDDGIVGEDKLRIISIDDMEINNPTEWQWSNNQEIEIEVRVQNKDTKTHNYGVELIYVQDGSAEEIVKDSDNLIKEISIGSMERETVLFKFEVDEDVEGDYELFVKLYEKDNENEMCTENSERDIAIKKIEICKDGNVDDSKLEINFIKDLDNDNPWIWKPGKEVEIKIEVENKKYEDNEYFIELIFMNQKNEVVDFLTESADDRTTINVAKDETDDRTLSFVLKNNIDVGEYYLYAKVYSQDDDQICTSLRAEKTNNPRKIKIDREQNSVVISKVYGPEELFLGDSVSYIVKVFNAGANDEDQVNVRMYNSLLNLDMEETILDLESGSEKEVIFNFDVGEDINDTPKTLIYFSTEFEYNSAKETYRKFSNDDEGLEYTAKLTKKEIIKEPVEPEVIEEKNINNISDLIEKPIDEVVTSPITGNVVDTSTDEESGFGFMTIILIVIFIFIVIAIFVVIKKNTEKEAPSYKSRYDNYKVTRRYSASVN